MNRQVFFRTVWLVLGFWLVVLNGCVEQHPNNPLPNQPPKTFLWLFPDSTLAEGISKQHIRWWGEDPDGFVIGSLFSFAIGITQLPSPDTLTYVWLTASDTLIQFPLLTARETFLVVVRAVDNTFEGLPDGSRVRLTPRPYWDKNMNGILDSGEELSSLETAMDITGARLAFPIRNSPPSVRFRSDPADPTRTIQQPETTYTVASFSWVGSDPDGDETIASFRIALNGTDSSRWRTVSANISLVTLIAPRNRTDGATGEVDADMYSGTFPNMRQIGTLPGLRLDQPNVFYLQSTDVAGDVSQIVQLPDTGRTWFVKKPRGKLLLISDYQKSDSLAVRNFYRLMLGSVGGGRVADFDVLDIRTGSPIGTPGKLVPAILNPQFVHTLKLYEAVIWYTDQFPSLSVAQFPLYLYSSTGGRVLYTTEFQSAVTDPRGSLVDFAPLDSISISLTDTRLPARHPVSPDSSIPSGIYPALSTDSLNVTGQPVTNHIVFVREVFKRADARYIYHVEPVPGRFTSSPNVAVIDNEKRFVFLGLPLHILNGSANGGQGVLVFLNKVLIDEFGL